MLILLLPFSYLIQPLVFHLFWFLSLRPDVPAHHFAHSHTRVILVPLLRHHLQTLLDIHSCIRPFLSAALNSYHPSFVFFWFFFFFFCSFDFFFPPPASFVAKVTKSTGKAQHLSRLQSHSRRVGLDSTLESTYSTTHHRPHLSLKKVRVKNQACQHCSWLNSIKKKTYKCVICDVWSAASL